MNQINIVIVISAILFFGCNSDNHLKTMENKKSILLSRKYTGLRLETTYIGTFYNYEDPDLTIPECNLIQVDLINDTDSSLEFISQRAGPYINVVLDKKGYSQLGPCFISNNTGGHILESGQVITFPILIYKNKSFSINDMGPIKVGFILLSWDKSYKVFQQLPELFSKWKKTYENVIWSNPIDLSYNKQKNCDYLWMINDTTFSYSKK